MRTVLAGVDWRAALVGRVFNQFVSLRWLLVVAQATTILLTWELWQVREHPPLLPAVTCPQIDMGLWLLVSLVVVLVKPRIGIALHAVLLVFAMAADQSRIQPQIVSHVILLSGTLAPLRMLARSHLVALWFYAGISKLLSPGFSQGTAWYLLSGIAPNANREQAAWFAVLIWSTEILVPILLLPRRTRKVAAGVGIAMHAFVLLLLSPIFLNYNSAVWPWNISLAAAAFVFFFKWNESLVPAIVRVPGLLKAGLLVLLLSPIGNYFGMLDAYLSHNLYSDHVPMAVIRSRDGTQRDIATQVYLATNAPLPPEHRLYDAYFVRVAKPGDVMIVTDPRWCYRKRPVRIKRYDWR